MTATRTASRTVGQVPQLARELVTAHVGQPDVDQHHLGPKRARLRQRLGAGPGDADLVAVSRSSQADRLSATSRLSSTTRIRRGGRVAAAARCGSPAPACALGGVRQQGQPHGEPAAAARPVAGAGHRSAVHLDEAAHQRQPDAEPALRAPRRRVRLHEQIEHLRQRRRVDSDAVVADDDRTHDCRRPLSTSTLTPSRPPSGVNLAALFSRLETTCARRVGSPLHAQALARLADGQVLLARLDQRPRRLDRARHDRVDLDRLEAQADLAPRDARDVQQVVDQARELVDLPVDDVARPLQPLRRRRRFARRRLGRVADRRQRVAQLVRQHRQELVLAASLDQQLVASLLFGQVGDDQAVDVGVVDRARSGSSPPAPAPSSPSVARSSISRAGAVPRRARRSALEEPVAVPPPERTGRSSSRPARCRSAFTSWAK